MLSTIVDAPLSAGEKLSKTIFRLGWGAAMVLFDLGARIWRYRLLLVAALFFAAVMLALGYRAATAMTSETGGELLPMSTRFAAGAGLALLGLAAPVVLTLYGLRVVTRIEQQGDSIVVHTLSVITPRQSVVPASKLRLGLKHDPVVMGQHAARAPWRTLHLQGRRSPLLLDLQAQIVREEAIFQLTESTRDD